MRFSRSDLPALALAVFAGPALMILFLAAFETWGHRGTPVLGFMGTNIGIGVGLAAVFARFIRNWDWPIAFLALLLAAVAGVNWAQHSDNDGTRIATGMKFVGVIAFLGLNVAVVLQILKNGVLPLLDRFDARRAAEAAEQQ